ncbi:hypothetical protein QO004_004346 [Rhizobium mesoamericanum]|nr:hypothetical protein [Rhizobium mesoamericanum]
MRRAICNARARLSPKAACPGYPLRVTAIGCRVLFQFSVEVGEGDTLARDQAFLLS